MRKPTYILFFLSCLLTACNFSIINPDDTEQHNPAVTDTTDDRTPDQKRDISYLFDLDALPVITITVTDKMGVSVASPTIAIPVKPSADDKNKSKE